METQPGYFKHGPAEAMYGRGAILSPDDLYRYRLWRIWDDDRAPTAFLMLNPSTADATLDDPTIRRCVGFAKRWGSGGIVVVNLFARRATDPAELLEHDRADVVGPDNDEHLRAVFRTVDSVVCAWGAHPVVRRNRVGEVLSLIPPGVEVSCLGTTKDGHPKHPLYLRADTERVPFRGGSNG
jgi:hypothetical protein